ncbi:sensor histidine kinase [Lacrimispora saccharolytica]|uniref:histidine kinase n=1 Tax=Lacrimispora saccharolytica (strain ATCC 35040 / DSM 2544 / NRCC 2533 / WM1) TaxID=610130 RepID=D9R309_LACSW|nr:sensor histidine kinase [Lacrimispora saccharolytica]ADL02999.1 integral membrane sensor signal transduction histidine kinase [[Clostridium] saccharolyticum WM1]QRV18815.1 sensor histidine kinase [Lacrimispora saccharolytica]
MDIKLRNRHRISIILAMIVVLLAASVMVGLYPFFKNESARYEEPVYGQDEFLKHLVLGNYVLYLEQAQYEQGSVISPFQFYFPLAEEELRNAMAVEAASEVSETEAGAGGDAAEDADADEEVFIMDAQEERREYLKELRQSCVREYESWNRYFGGMRNFLDYQILDASGKVLTDHAGGRSIAGSDEYTFKAVLRYDDLGRMETGEVSGVNGSRLFNSLGTLGGRDPMSDYYWDQYRYETDLKLKNPRNVTFAYGMRSQQIAAFEEERETVWNAYNYSGSVSRIFMGLICAVVIAAFFFSCLDPGLPDISRLLRTPLEVVAGVACGAVFFGTGLTNLVVVTNRGDLYDALMRANFLPLAARIMVKFWNLMWWSIPFAIVYWAVICSRDVFRIGLKRYLHERTLCGWFWQWVKNLCHRVYTFVGNINLQERSDRTIFRIVGVNFIILAILCSLWFFGIGALILYSIALFIVMRKYYRDLSDKYSILLRATNQIAEGNLEVSIEEDLSVFEPFKKSIQKIQKGFKVAVVEEVKSQKLKTDLISNMSHDLKTPLTAIITYVNLLRDDHATPEQRKAYIDILEQKSMRLKSLIEDLFEISKANSNNVTLNLEDVDIVSLLKEVSLELSDKIEESTIDFRWNLPDEKIVLPLDSQKTYRIFDNLLSNIIKYAMPNTRAYIDMKKEGEYVVTTLKNVSAAELTFNPDEITERFVRGDQSRNTEGSGLGMAIAKSFVELQNGKLQIEVEADLFRVIIRWPIS